MSAASQSHGCYDRQRLNLSLMHWGTRWAVDRVCVAGDPNTSAGSTADVLNELGAPCDTGAQCTAAVIVRLVCSLTLSLVT